ncbi:hypothetical protein ESY86_20575 [Subsaximicrobium wynnwilliamsii]|uniref:Uncharacterized protein n=1 Tax=Subsaximicrobium wynnwilliamsii TaxID=291179 RepID=A0A5C6ZBK2_9FLAO|nr:hypothetical protein [Subsaximicrobium wynnwilliamsii]TXD80496.1 hypothetical protein ESY87_20620 [Subsaximicrobium wynnwilliamsii]TXD86142.1 hypothetical protein ESY86_20575 [Subsaximicrobium wynnwilliamsii]TXD99452.1 hypothetical protein ESY88_20575 [Subsaximicrobium wynnwilliamsii]
MKKILIILLIGISNIAFSQTMKEIDSVSYVMCDYLKNLEIKNDTLKINSLYEKQLYPYLGKFEQSKTQKIGQQVYYRLQRNCVEFRNLLDRLEPPREEVIRITEKPKSEISKKQLKEFKKQREFYYFEVAGDTTKVIMENGKWTDSFSNKTFSKLTYNWINETEFELVFIESDNETRSNFSVIGDKYIYQILSKEDEFYLMTVNILGQKTFEKFKMYYE